MLMIRYHRNISTNYGRIVIMVVITVAFETGDHSCCKVIIIFILVVPLMLKARVIMVVITAVRAITLKISS